MSTQPPGDNRGSTPSPRWISPAEEERSSDSGRSPARRARMVGSVVDPAADDGLGLTGPGAPGSAFAKPEEHPVRARLLEKARHLEAGGEVPVSSGPESSRNPGIGLPSLEESLFTPGSASPGDISLLPQTVASPGASAPAPMSALAAPSASPIPSGATTTFDPPASAAPQETIDSSSSAFRQDPVPSSGPRTFASRGEFAAPGEEIAPLTPPPGAVASELDRIARRPAPESAGPGLSPNMIAVLGGLLGLTVITTLGVFLSRAKSDVTPAPQAEVKNEAPAPEKEEAPILAPRREKIPGPWRIQDDSEKPGHRVLSGKIGKVAFLSAIQEAGLSKSEAYRAYNALKDLRDLDHCKSTDSFLALVEGSSKTLVAFEYILGKEEVYQAKVNAQGTLEAKKLDLKVIRNQIRRSFTHDGKSFEESARRAGFDPGLSTIAEEALRGHASLSEFKAGDRFRVIAQEVTVLGEFARYAGIEALEIVRPGKDPQRVYFYPHPVEGGYFDKAGKAPYAGGWRKPIPGAPVTSKFNMKRMHPVLNKVMPHTGTDFGAPSGTPIGSTAPGTVTFVGNGGPSGNLVKVKHEGGYESGYAHLSRFAEGLKVGDTVDRLQLVGYCGSTGRSTGPHLHFTMKKDDKFIDPESLSLDGMRVLPKAHREEFALVQTKYDPILDQVPLPKALPVAPVAPEPAASEDGALAEAEPGAENEEGDEGEAFGMMAEEGPPASKSPAPVPAAPKKSEAKAAPSVPAKAQEPSAIFLSDTDLLKMQSSSDDGEVAE